MGFLILDFLQKRVQGQIVLGGYANAKKYISGLIHRDQQRGDKVAALQEAITCGIESGPAGELDMEAIKREARQQIQIPHGTADGGLPPPHLNE